MNNTTGNMAADIEKNQIIVEEKDGKEETY